MEPPFPLALQVVLYTVSVAIVVLAAVLVHVLLRVKSQLDRVVTAAEHLEAEVTPLARETRVVVGRVRDLSERVQRQLVAAEVMGGALLAPARAVNGALQLLRAGVTAFVVSLWNGPRQA